MLKILIIDDDTLTRKGIKSLMPWKKHNMEIAAEAANGKDALDILEKQNVDLALVDLDMPIMDGMTFIKKAKELYPLLNYVVLTVHTEFEYIQRVLRMGALDYIAKTSFDQENFDQILERITVKIRENTLIAQKNGFLWKSQKILHSAIYALISAESESDEQPSLFLELNGLSNNISVCEITAGVWVFIDERNSFLFPEIFTNTILVCISDVRDVTYEQLGKIFRSYRAYQFFYDCKPVNKINYKSIHELERGSSLSQVDIVEDLKTQWTSLNWLHDTDLFNGMKLNLEQTRLQYSKLYALLFNIANIWNFFYSGLSGLNMEVPSQFYFWTEVENWLSYIYKKTNEISSSVNYSPLVVKNILMGKKYIDTHFMLQLKAAEVSQEAHMSYGYFSRCFHSIIGMPVNDYCTRVRISKAKEYLLTTSTAVQEIAVKVGYIDEKYFSRIFKKITGYNPLSFRKTRKTQVKK